MRVISGKYRGKKLKGFDIDGTRPTMDRVKESLFGMIQSYVNGALVLDLFAGSGALGVEAISEGAMKVIFVDNNMEAIRRIEENVSGFDEDFEIIHTDYKKYLKSTDDRFDIIFLDPPYKSDSLNKALRIIEERNLLTEDGIVVCEFEEGKIVTGLNKIKEKSYGHKKICIFHP